MDHESFTLCSWCHAKLSAGSVLVTAALAERSRKRPMCLKCSVWSLTGHTPPYLPTALEHAPVVPERPTERYRRAL